MTCCLDGRTVSKAKAMSYRDPRTGKRYYVCDGAERRQLLELLAAGKQPPHGAQGGGS